MLGSYDADNGFDGSVTQSGDTFVVTGTFTKQDSANTDLQFPLGEDTGYYLPIQFTGQTGYAIKRTSNGKINVFGETGDTDTTMNVIVSVDPSSPVINYVEYTNRTDAVIGSNGTPFTVDCSACSFN